MALIALQQIVGDTGGMAYFIAGRTLQQTHAAPEMLARADASLRTLGYGATLVGALVSGMLAEQFGARALLFSSSGLLGLAALVAALLLHQPQPAELSR